MTQTQIHATITPCTPILSADPTVKEDAMLDQQKSPSCIAASAMRMRWMENQIRYRIKKSFNPIRSRAWLHQPENSGG